MRFIWLVCLLLAFQHGAVQCSAFYCYCGNTELYSTQSRGFDYTIISSTVGGCGAACNQAAPTNCEDCCTTTAASTSECCPTTSNCYPSCADYNINACPASDQYSGAQQIFAPAAQQDANSTYGNHKLITFVFAVVAALMISF